MTYNKDRTKILVPITKTNPDDPNETITTFCYVPYPGSSTCKLNRKKKAIAKRYGQEDYKAFWIEIEELAHGEEYNSPWAFVNDNRLDDYYVREPVKKKRRKDPVEEKKEELVLEV